MLHAEYRLRLFRKFVGEGSCREREVSVYFMIQHWPMTSPHLDDAVLIQVLRCESLYSNSERKRCVALMLKQKAVPVRVISEMLGVSGQTIQGWWRDWQADPDFAAIIDRRRAYAITVDEQKQVVDYLGMEPPYGIDAWSIRALAKVLSFKTQRVETILKMLCRVVPDRVPGDERLRSGVYERRQRTVAEDIAKTEPIDPEREKVFSDTLEFIEQLESGKIPDEARQKDFDNVLAFIENREAERDDGPGGDNPGTVSPRPKNDKNRDRNFEDALRFIDEQERKRDT